MKPKITFEPSEFKPLQFDFTYEFIKDGLLIECDGSMQPYHSGRAMEHNIVIDYLSVDNEEVENWIGGFLEFLNQGGLILVI
jgi:hypothetical protein